MPNLDDLQKALASIEGRTPKEVLDAFIPEGKKFAGHDLAEITYGHALFLAQTEHPLSKGSIEGWTASDIALALFAFTRPSKDLHVLISKGTMEDELYEFVNSIPMSEIAGCATMLIAHYFGATQTIIEMESNTGAKAQKKTLSDGFYRRLLAFVVSITGRLITLFTRSR